MQKRHTSKDAPMRVRDPVIGLDPPSAPMEGAARSQGSRAAAW